LIHDTPSAPILPLATIAILSVNHAILTLISATNFNLLIGGSRACFHLGWVSVLKGQLIAIRLHRSAVKHLYNVRGKMLRDKMLRGKYDKKSA
jgi:hypothetical protein